MNSRDIIRAIEADGWVLVRVTGTPGSSPGGKRRHHHFRHPAKPGTVTVPHPKKDIALGTLRNIERQSGLALRR